MEQWHFGIQNANNHPLELASQSSGNGPRLLHMTLGLAVYILMLLWLVLGLYRTNWGDLKGSASASAPWLLLFFILLLICWSEFGAPLHK